VIISLRESYRLSRRAEKDSWAEGSDRTGHGAHGLSDSLREFRADLHIHSALSPCASLDLSPRKIVDAAQSAGLDIIAITDHNSAGNVDPIIRLGKRAHLNVFPGMEVQSREEIHLLTLFPDGPSIASWNEEVRRSLPMIRNDPEIFGYQPILDEEGNILGFEDRLLLNSTSFSMREIHQKVRARGGITIAAHFDKASFSLMSQLGIIPLDMELEALEISRAARGAGRGSRGERAASFPSIASSDAHEVREIGLGYTVFLLAAPTLDELRLAFRGQQGRRIVQTVIDGEKIS